MSFKRNNLATATRCIEYIRPNNGASAPLTFSNLPFTPSFFKGLQHKSKQERESKDYKRANRRIPKNVMQNIDVQSPNKHHMYGVNIKTKGRQLGNYSNERMLIRLEKRLQRFEQHKK